MIERRERIRAGRAEGLSCAEIGRRLGISGTRVAQVVREAEDSSAIRRKMEDAGVLGLLSLRTFRVLARARLTLEATRTMSDDALYAVPNLGERTLAEMRRAAPRGEGDGA
jgi:hypothetical protein